MQPNQPPKGLPPASMPQIPHSLPNSLPPSWAPDGVVDPSVVKDSLRRESGGTLHPEVEARIDEAAAQSSTPTEFAAKLKGQSLRNKYLGRTPSKKSKTGREVISRMESEGKVRTTFDGSKEFKDSKGVWRPLSEADMAHRTDAVTWWNETGRHFGAKSPEVRAWMLDSNNYELDYYSINRSSGAALGQRYQPPLK